MKIAICSFLALIVGIVLGASWKRISDHLEGRDSIQWQFVEAAAAGDVPSLERLYKQGAKVKDGPLINGYPEAGFSALLRATMDSQVESAQWLLAHGADPNQQEGDATPGAIARYKVETANRLAALFPSPPKNTAEQDAAANP